MYTEYYRLAESPFNVTPDPKFLYLTETHETALNHLRFAIYQRKGFMLLTGEVGTGKTTLCRELLAELGGEYHTGLILNPMLTASQLLRAIVAEFGLAACPRDRLGCLNLLNSFLLSASRAGRDAVLVIDEAQDMTVEALEMTRLLSNLETDSQKLLQIVLVGQPELRERLRAPNLRQLAQRITVAHHLRAMTREETSQYLRHRLAVAGNDGAVEFDEQAVSAVYEYTSGTPRMVNTLCDKALLAGYANHAERIDEAVVRLAAEEIREAA